MQEERTIYQLIQRIETQALERRDDMPAGEFTFIRETAPAVQLPMERRLYAPPQATKLVSPVLQAGSGDDGELTAIFDQVIVDRKKLQENIEELLAERPEVTLAEVLAVNPLQQGLPELLGYLVLASHAASEAFDSSTLEHIIFERDGHRLMAVCDKVVFRRNQG